VRFQTLADRKKHVYRDAWHLMRSYRVLFAGGEVARLLPARAGPP